MELKTISQIEELHGDPEFIAQIPIHFARKWGILGVLLDDSKGIPEFHSGEIETRNEALNTESIHENNQHDFIETDIEGQTDLAISGSSESSTQESLKNLHLLVSEPINLDVLDTVDNVGRHLKRSPQLHCSDRDKILEAINRAYEQHSEDTQLLMEEVDKKPLLDELENLESEGDLLDSKSRAPVIRLVNMIIFEAIKAGASDIHLQPTEEGFQVRYRIDGMLFDHMTIPTYLHDEVTSRFKIVGRMNIAEKRLAQDGRATVTVGDRIIDLRFSTVPANFGERIVIRLLDKSQKLYTLEEIGFGEDELDVFRHLISVEHGLILVSGPTGSGKSTTLYAALQEINSHEKNIITLEDPIEYRLEGVSQIQVSERKGMTFASGLRNVLRQDPDIIMVGEIRDQETAVMAIQSALTGHLVFSTLHTNDAASAVTRLLDLGIEPYLVSSSLVGVLAQRLVRRICKHCAQSIDISKKYSNVPKGNYQEGQGCEKCRGTGYKGRLGLLELLVADISIRNLIQKSGNAGDIKSQSIRSGLKTLRDDGIKKAARGLTTLEEVNRVTANTVI